MGLPGNKPLHHIFHLPESERHIFSRGCRS